MHSSTIRDALLPETGLSAGEIREAIAAMKKDDVPVFDAKKGSPVYFASEEQIAVEHVDTHRREAVALLRKRARQKTSYRKPYFRNEELWGKGGVTWNKIARYFRARIVPVGAIFGDAAATITPTVDWLSTDALLALLNAPVIDFLMRTFLASLMNKMKIDVQAISTPGASELERFDSVLDFLRARNTRDYALKEIYADAVLDYSPLKPTWFVVSGRRGDRMFYRLMDRPFNFQPGMTYVYTDRCSRYACMVLVFAPYSRAPFDRMWAPRLDRFFFAGDRNDRYDGRGDGRWNDRYNDGRFNGDRDYRGDWRDDRSFQDGPR